MGWNRTQNRHEIVLTKRPMTVANHKGEVCFPGGVREKADENFLATALRELDEEIGIKTGDIEVIGTLPPVRTRGDVWILPWVAQLSLPYPYQVNDKEVEKVLSLPVSQLLEVGLETVNVTVGSATVQSPGLWVENELVWGATARMLVELRAALFEAFVAHKAGGQSN